jgi:chromate transport protein ChrA
MQALSGIYESVSDTAFFSFFETGVTACGGPAMVPYIGKLAIKQRGWLDEKTFHEGIAI